MACLLNGTGLFSFGAAAKCSSRSDEARRLLSTWAGLERQDGLDQGQRPEPQGADLEDEPEDHARHPQQPDRPPGQAEDEPDIKARPS
jgi:hypothetical protein